MFLNGAVSQNASYVKSISVRFPNGFVPQMFGTVGLFIPPGTEGTVSVQLHALTTINIEGGNFGKLYINIVRGSVPTDPLVYSSVKTYIADVTELIIEQFSATATDYNVPIPPNRFLQYTAFFLSEDLGTRIGPESFHAFAFSTP